MLVVFAFLRRFELAQAGLKLSDRKITLNFEPSAHTSQALGLQMFVIVPVYTMPGIEPQDLLC